MTKLYFVRHGKTEWNLQARFQGAQGDSPLLKQSLSDARSLAKHFQATAFKHIYASPIKRARDTANIIAHDLKKCPQVSLESRLAEFDLGKMEGMTYVEATKEFPRQYADFRNHPADYDPTVINGESYVQVIARMAPFIQRVAQKYTQSEDNVMLVSHGAALNAIINHLLGAAIPDLRKRGGIANTSTTILETKNAGTSFQLIDWNDTSYLDRVQDKTDSI